jgi:Zn-finger nucleic acid-binding protein
MPSDICPHCGLPMIGDDAPTWSAEFDCHYCPRCGEIVSEGDDDGTV